MLPRSGLLKLIDEQGSATEKQLIRRWNPEVESFLSAFAGGIQQGEQLLEIGLESALVLKIGIKHAILPPAAGLLRISASLPAPLVQVAGMAINQGLRLHVELQLQADTCHREIHIHERGNMVARALARQGLTLPPTPGNKAVTLFSIDETSRVSACFLTDPGNPAFRDYARELTARISQELRYDVTGHIGSLWDQMQLHEGRWNPSRFGIDLKDVSVELATRIISHYRPPHFRYLIPLRPYRAIRIAGTVETGSVDWSFTL